MLSIKVSEAAQAYLRRAITQQNGAGLRITIKKTGCSGFSYEPSVIQQTEIHSQDQSLKMDDQLAIYIDSRWIALLDNLTIDYQEENVSGLKQKRLIISSPHETSRCGCGESFHVEP